MRYNYGADHQVEGVQSVSLVRESFWISDIYRTNLKLMGRVEGIFDAFWVISGLHLYPLTWMLVVSTRILFCNKVKEIGSELSPRFNEAIIEAPQTTPSPDVMPLAKTNEKIAGAYNPDFVENSPPDKEDFVENSPPDKRVAPKDLNPIKITLTSNNIEKKMYNCSRYYNKGKNNNGEIGSMMRLVALRSTA